MEKTTVSDVTYEEYEYLKRSVNGIDKMSFNLFTRNENIKYESKTVNSIRVKPSTEDFFDIEPVKLIKVVCLMKQSLIQEVLL